MQLIHKSVGNPQQGDVHVDAPLTNFSQAWFTAKDAEIVSGIGDCPVPKQSDVYWEWSRDDILRGISKLYAPGAPVATIGASVSTTSFYCPVRAIATIANDFVGENADAGLGYDRGLSDLVSEAMMRAEETEFAATVMTAGSWGANTSTPGTLWDVDGSNPSRDAATAIDVIEKATGKRVNVAIMGAPVWKALKNNASILNRLGLGGMPSDPRMVTREAVAQLFGVDRVLVSNVVANSANPNATASVDYVIGKHVLFAHVPEGNAQMAPSAFKRFTWGLRGAGPGGRRMLRYRVEPHDTYIQGEHAFVSKVTSTALGYFLASVVS